MSYNVGDTVIVDGIESLIIYDNGSETVWGRYIVVDKNHDLPYYIFGENYINDVNRDTYDNTGFPEWGGEGITTGITSQEIGDGLSNTNSLISLNLQPTKENWPVLWDMVSSFRQTYSDKWFVPTSKELALLKGFYTKLENFTYTTDGASWYWTSTEYSNTIAYTYEAYYYLIESNNKDDSYTRIRLFRYTTDEELDSIPQPPKIGDTVTLDGIESVIVYDAGVDQDWGRFVLVDKNHDLSYYITGSDYVDNDDTTTSPGTFGYEWGGLNRETDITSRMIGDGLSNTNSLISKNLRPNTSGWRVVWDMVSQFRSSHSDRWFVPTVNELKEVYNQRSYLNNLSISTNKSYWCSTENSNTSAYFVLFDSGISNYHFKSNHSSRTRLCRYTTLAELSSNILITCSTPSSTIYYTTDNSNPDSSKNLYTSTFEATLGTVIKAVGTREGWLDSNVAMLTVGEETVSSNTYNISSELILDKQK